jgi:hypothetical protein
MNLTEVNVCVYEDEQDDCAYSPVPDNHKLKCRTEDKTH